MASTAASEKLDWSGCPLIRCEPGKLGGAPNIDGMRITPEAILDNYEDGCSIAEISNEIFPGVTQEQIRTILTYASEKGYLDHPYAAWRSFLTTALQHR